MNELNHLYVKVQDFISKTQDIKELSPVLKKIGRLSPKDTFTRIKNEIIIEDDWISFAESKMKYVEAAVYENRQFIREDGEVLPIERVKKISRTSVEHLARHSDYIEKFNPEEDELVPGKIYTVNKDTDYGVYENKFLYLLLMTLTDFVSRERDEISSSLKQESGVFSIVRQNELFEDDVNLDIRMSFKTSDAESSLEESERSKLLRMENLKGRAQALLSTPLMSVVSKEPMISTSITKTNVLSMNENFSNSLELFEFLINYEKKSYSCKKVVEPIVVQSEFSYPILALELLIQAVKDDCVEDYEHKMREIEAEERKKALEQMEARLAELKAKCQENPAAYILVLEDKITLLGALNIEIDNLKAEIRQMNKTNEELQKDKNTLEDRIVALQAKLEECKIRIEGFEVEKKKAIEDAQKQIDKQATEIHELEMKLQEKDKQIEKAIEEKQEVLKQTISQEVKINALQDKLDSLEEEMKKLKALHEEENEKKDEELRLLRAQHIGIQAEALELKPEDADCKKEAFDELEREYNAFTAYYEAVWEKTKKEIKKEIKKDSKRKKG